MTKRDKRDGVIRGKYRELNEWHLPRKRRRQDPWKCKPNKNDYHTFVLFVPNYIREISRDATPEEIEAWYQKKDMEYEERKNGNPYEYFWKPSRMYKCSVCGKGGWNEKRVKEAIAALNSRAKDGTAASPID